MDKTIFWVLRWGIFYLKLYQYLRYKSGFRKYMTISTWKQLFFWGKLFFSFLLLFCSWDRRQMSIFMSQGLWEMLPRATRGQSLPSSIPGELSMSARGQCLAGRTQFLLSVYPVVCPLKWKKILYSVQLYKMSI